MSCIECGKTTNHNYKGMCKKCYTYFKNGGVIHPLPPKGEVVRDEKGKVICHICGKSYIRLGSHVKETHHMTIYQYKEMFGLCNNAKTTEENYSNKMKKYAYKNGLVSALIENGKNTRIQAGEENIRRNKKARLQEIIEKQKRCRGEAQ